MDSTLDISQDIQQLKIHLAKLKPICDQQENEYKKLFLSHSISVDKNPEMEFKLNEMVKQLNKDKSLLNRIKEALMRAERLKASRFSDSINSKAANIIKLNAKLLKAKENLKVTEKNIQSLNDQSAKLMGNMIAVGYHSNENVNGVNPEYLKLYQEREKIKKEIDKQEKLKSDFVVEITETENKIKQSQGV